MYQGHQTRVADARMAISGRHIVPGAANSMLTNHPGRQIARGGPRRHPQHAVEDRGCRGHPQLETCVCMPNAPRKHMLQWQQGPRLAAKREIGHGLMREKHGGGGDGRPGGAACANRAYNRGLVRSAGQPSVLSTSTGDTSYTTLFLSVSQLPGGVRRPRGELAPGWGREL